MQVAIQHHSCCHTTDDALHCQQQSTSIANHQAFVVLQDGIPLYQQVQSMWDLWWIQCIGTGLPPNTSVLTPILSYQCPIPIQSLITNITQSKKETNSTFS